MDGDGLTTGTTVDTTSGKERIEVKGQSATGSAAIEGVPRNFRLRATLRMTGHGSFGVVARGTGRLASGQELRFEPDEQSVGWRPVKANSLERFGQSTISKVDGLERAVSLDVVVKGDVFDACINGRRTVIDREASATGDRIFFVAHNGSLTVTNLHVSPLGEQ